MQGKRQHAGRVLSPAFRRAPRRKCLGLLSIRRGVPVRGPPALSVSRKRHPALGRAVKCHDTGTNQAPSSLLSQGLLVSRRAPRHRTQDLQVAVPCTQQGHTPVADERLSIPPLAVACLSILPYLHPLNPGRISTTNLRKWFACSFAPKSISFLNKAIPSFVASLA